VGAELNPHYEYGLVTRWPMARCP